MVKIMSLICIASRLMVGDTTDLVKAIEINKQIMNVKQDLSEQWQVDLKIKLKDLQETLGYTSQIDILDLQYKEGVLTIDLSEELIHYGGGNEVEYVSIKYLLDWGFSYQEVQSITLKIEGKTDRFPEGSEIVLCSRNHYQLYYQQ